MGLFGNKKEDKKKGSSNNSDSNSDEPPELPKLPELPDIESESSANSSKESKKEKHEPLPKLPSYPNSSSGDKFSQNSIKQAVTGEKGDEEADDFESEATPKQGGDNQEQMMQQSPDHSEENYNIEKHSPGIGTPKTKEYKETTQHQKLQQPEPQGTSNVYQKEKQSQQDSQRQSNGPVFIRIDKFEDSLKSFEKIKEEISEVGELLKNAKETKQEEDKELKSWEEKMQRMKEKLSKIDSDIFSKV